MPKRRQALRRSKAAAASLFLTLILSFFFASQSLPMKAETASSIASAAAAGAQLGLLDPVRQAALFAFLLVALSAITLRKYRRRDDTSPRRIGRRI